LVIYKENKPTFAHSHGMHYISGVSSPMFKLVTKPHQQFRDTTLIHNSVIKLIYPILTINTVGRGTVNQKKNNLSG